MSNPKRRQAGRGKENYLVVIPWSDLERSARNQAQAKVGHVKARSLKAAIEYIAWFMEDEDALTDLLVEPGTRRVSPNKNSKRPRLKDYGISVGKPHVEKAADVLELDTDWANCYFICKGARVRMGIG